MLDIRHAPPAPPVPISGSSASAASTASLISAFSTGHFVGKLEELVKSFSAGSSSDSMAALPIPVSFGGRLTPGPLFTRISKRPTG